MPSELRDGTIEAMRAKMSDAAWTDCDYCEQCEIEGCVGHEEPSFAPSVLLDALLDYLQEHTDEIAAEHGDLFIDFMRMAPTYQWHRVMDGLNKVLRDDPTMKGTEDGISIP